MHSYGLTQLPPPQPYSPYLESSLYPRRVPHTARHQSLERAVQNRRLGVEDQLDAIQANFETKRECLHRGAPSVRNLPEASYNAHRQRLTDLDVNWRRGQPITSPSQFYRQELEHVRASRHADSLAYQAGRLPDPSFHDTSRRRFQLANNSGPHYWHEARY
jgi:hypothetical protein